MTRYVIMDHPHFLLIIKSNAALFEIKQAMQEYKHDETAHDIVDKEFGTDNYEIDRIDKWEVRAYKSFIINLKAKGFAVGIEAAGNDAVTKFIDEHYGGRSIFDIIDLSPRPGAKVDMFSGSKDQTPIVAIKRIGKDGYITHQERGPGPTPDRDIVNEVRKIIRGIIK